MTAGEVINKNIRYGGMVLVIAQRNLYGEDKDAVVSIKMKISLYISSLASKFVRKCVSLSS